jgi:hypothetical protein
MARHPKKSQHVGESDDVAFDRLARSGEPAEDNGIYRCERCGIEIPLRRGEILPREHHRDEHPEQRASWRLIVLAESED